MFTFVWGCAYPKPQKLIIQMKQRSIGLHLPLPRGVCPFINVNIMSYLTTSETLLGALDTLDIDCDACNIEKRLKISTMTLQFQTSKFDEIDDVFRDAGPETRMFRNCVTIKVINSSIKIFRNNSVHITGCTGITQAVETIHLAFPHIIMTTVTIHLINACFKFRRDVDMLRTFEAMQHEECFVSYDTSIHAAMNIKFEKHKIGGTILLYRTGSVVLAGFKVPDHLVLAVKFLTTFFDRRDDCMVQRKIAPKVLKKRGRKSNADNEQFYQSLLGRL